MSEKNGTGGKDDNDRTDKQLEGAGAGSGLPQETTSVEVSPYKGMVIMTMNREIRWLGMPPDVARDFAQKVLEVADMAEKGDTASDRR